MVRFRITSVAVFGLYVVMSTLPALARAGHPPPPSAEQASGADKASIPVVVIGALEKASEPAKITDKKHPDYVQCRSEAVLGSRASRTRVCRTNREWAAAARAGNRETQEFMNIGRPTQPSP
jgi:hypothetical protein